MTPEQELRIASSVEESDDVAPVGPPVRPWLTMGLTLVAMVASVVTASAGIGIFLFVQNVRTSQSGIDVRNVRVETNGDLMSLGTWAGTIVVVPLVLLFARIVSGPFAGEHLGLRRPSAKSFVQWILLAIAFFAASDGLMFLFGQEIVPDWMRETYTGTDHPILLWLALLVAAPVGEELLFRGFLFDGLARSRIGPIAAAVVVSLLWASVHIQYDFFVIGMIFVGGLMLAAARYYTRSVIPCIAIHSLQNFISTLEVFLALRWHP